MNDPARQLAACTNPAYTAPEDDSKAVQSVGQIIGEVMKQLNDDRCACTVSAQTEGFVSHRQDLFRTVIRRVLLALPEYKVQDSKVGMAGRWGDGQGGGQDGRPNLRTERLKNGKVSDPVMPAKSQIPRLIISLIIALCVVTFSSGRATPSSYLCLVRVIA